MLKFSLIRNCALPHQPTRPLIAKCLRAALQQKFVMVTLTISIVDKETSQRLNRDYRQKDKPTNVISLEYPEQRTMFNFLSGELILCDEVILEEARQQNKEPLAHYAHMLVHGLLHLQGYDHMQDIEAEVMEQLEINILAKLGFANPYIEC